MTANFEALSEREKETLRFLLEGHDAKSIARNLGLSVHTVNERLRASRRKLEVSSSREAARLLAQSEQRTPNSLVDKQIGVAGSTIAGNGRTGVEHPLILVIGGMLIMSLIIAAAMLAWTAPEDTDRGSLPNWSTAAAPPAHMPGQMNTLRVDDNRLLWNGEEVPEEIVRIFLGIVNQLDPQPVTILSYSAQAPAARVKRARRLIEEVIRCKPSECLEITAPAP